MDNATSKTTRRPQWVIRITFPNGEDAYLRRGHRIGEGPIVKFGTKQLAELNAEFISDGLEASSIVVVRWSKDLEA